MFPTLLKKEIQEYLISVRFVVLLALCVLLIPLSLHVNFPRTMESLAQSVVDIGLLLGTAIALFAAASVAFIK